MSRVSAILQLLRVVARTYLPEPAKNVLKTSMVDVTHLDFSRRSMEKVLIRMLDEDENSVSPPFNRQEKRLEMYREIMRHLRFESIIETGTYLGDTTELFLDSASARVLTVELHPLFFAFSRRRFRNRTNFAIFNTSSVDFLRTLNHHDVLRDPCFLCLDAHWYDHLPLREELDIIKEKFCRYLVVVDDFKVETDQGYAFDVYGRDALCLDYISDQIGGHSVFFPRAPASAETGLRRGCVVLTRDGEFTRALDRCDSLVRFNRRRT
jgi:hypothetical protein